VPYLSLKSIRFNRRQASAPLLQNTQIIQTETVIKRKNYLIYPKSGS